VRDEGDDRGPGDAEVTQIAHDEFRSVNPFLITLEKESHEARVVKDRFVVRTPPDHP
jgi:hypothetical protein